MNETNYTCVNCQTQFHNEEQYKLHYKSEHHRYNVKRNVDYKQYSIKRIVWRFYFYYNWDNDCVRQRDYFPGRICSQ